MRSWALIGLALLVTLPALVLRLIGQPLEPMAAALVFGVAIVGAAFLLSWGAEAIQVDISQGLAIALLALITVLPEYAVDLYFAWVAGKEPEYIAYVAANMTGANRLLIGVGWSLIVVLFWFKSRRRALELGEGQSADLAFVGISSLYSLGMVVRGTIHWVDSIVLITLFAYYLWIQSRRGGEEPHLLGPSASIASLSTVSRRTITGLLFVFPAAVILASVGPFADGIVETGKARGIDEFIMVQWVAPLASEAPEIIVASLFVLRGQPLVAMGALISAKVNQWTLLLGSIPPVYSLSLGSLSGLPLDARQASEVLLTAAQAIFGVVLISKLQVSIWNALLLFLLFFTQLWFPDPRVRLGYTIVYFAIAFALIAFDGERRAALGQLVTQGLLRRSKNRGGRI